MRVNGDMENRMVKVDISYPMELLGLEYGKMVNVLDGWMRAIVQMLMLIHLTNHNTIL